MCQCNMSRRLVPYVSLPTAMTINEGLPVCKAVQEGLHWFCCSESKVYTFLPSPFLMTVEMFTFYSQLGLVALCQGSLAGGLEAGLTGSTRLPPQASCPADHCCLPAALPSLLAAYSGCPACPPPAAALSEPLCCLYLQTDS